MILLTLGRVYGGQRINSHSLYYSNPHKSFLSCRKVTINKLSKYEMHPSPERVKDTSNETDPLSLKNYEYQRANNDCTVYLHQHKGKSMSNME